ncbi:PaaI family thioesterase [Natrinema sp. 1APR25-10V2]|uniref:PaaI family thioesterase n=1 Tax=Natrinema sp. 1APR25-10V2 TaxID=2951081 RepID=UPI002875D0AA|nr:PaaI family thioesterase [Natrinema sp. 1APR25-10V2]MDS0477005.1 PaaI family thioesterase [Natrinema sp. 1APR25-10V2]
MDPFTITDSNPFAQLLGIELVEAEDGRAEARLPFRDDLSSNQHTEIAHGGATYALADHVGGMAAISAVGEVCPTIDMRIDYLAPVRSDLRATATVVRHGGQVAPVDIEVRDADDTCVATARGVYKVGRSSTEGGSESDDNPWLSGRGDSSD